MDNEEYAERLTKVETRVDTLIPTVNEIREDVKVLLAAHNRQKGMATVMGALFMALGSIGGLFVGKKLGG